MTHIKKIAKAIILLIETEDIVDIVIENEKSKGAFGVIIALLRCSL